MISRLIMTGILRVMPVTQALEINLGAHPVSGGKSATMQFLAYWLKCKFTEQRRSPVLLIQE
jgi:hypothetical protein